MRDRRLFVVLFCVHSRTNHLGNAAGTYSPVYADTQLHIPHNVNANRYIWTIPNHINENCALRIRYNISTMDYFGFQVCSQHSTAP